jgi:hypothetical protein
VARKNGKHFSKKRGMRMGEFLQHNGGIVATVLGIVIALNIFLTGLKGALEKIKDMTSTKVDDDLYAFLDKIVGFLTKVVDTVSANKEHK